MGTKIDDLWLPAGRHWDLHIEHSPAVHNAGAWVPEGAGWKFVVHITVSPWGAVDQMVDVVKAKRAEPHLVLGGRRGTELPVLVQLLPFDVASRSLQNDSSDGRQTNRAHAIQIEICANPGRDFRHLAAVDERKTMRAQQGTDLFALNDMFLAHVAVANMSTADAPLCMSVPADPKTDRVLAEKHEAFYSGVASWTNETYKAIGNVFELVRHRVPIPNKVPRSFTSTKRFTDAGWEKTSGIVGHMHAPDNDHIDPTTAFKGDRVVHFANLAPNDL